SWRARRKTHAALLSGPKGIGRLETAAVLYAHSRGAVYLSSQIIQYSTSFSPFSAIIFWNCATILSRRAITAFTSSLVRYFFVFSVNSFASSVFSFPNNCRSQRTRSLGSFTSLLKRNARVKSILQIFQFSPICTLVRLGSESDTN